MSSMKERVQYRVACTVMLWLLKGMCLGFGAFFAWRLCYALAAM